MSKLVNNKKSKNVWLMNKLANNKRNRKNHSKLKRNLLQEILVVHITKIVPQLELPGKLLYIKDNQVMTHILIVMAMELHVKNSSKKKLLVSFFLLLRIRSNYSSILLSQISIQNGILFLNACNINQ